MPDFDPKTMFAIYALAMNIIIVLMDLSFYRWVHPRVPKKYIYFDDSPRSRKISLALLLAVWNLMFLAQIFYFPKEPSQIQDPGQTIFQIAITLLIILFGIVAGLLAVLAAARLWNIWRSVERFPDPALKKRAYTKWTFILILSTGLFLSTHSILIPLAKAHHLTWTLLRR